jgi:hypothetical protein
MAGGRTGSTILSGKSQTRLEKPEGLGHHHRRDVEQNWTNKVLDGQRPFPVAAF